MATVREYVSVKLAGYSIELTAVELDGLLLEANVDGSSEHTQTNAIQAKTAIALAIPELLLKADVSEGGYSVKWNRDGITAYYGLLCSELGLDNKLISAPTIRDRSNIW